MQYFIDIIRAGLTTIDPNTSLEDFLQMAEVSRQSTFFDIVAVRDLLRAHPHLIAELQSMPEEERFLRIQQEISRLEQNANENPRRFHWENEAAQLSRLTDATQINQQIYRDEMEHRGGPGMRR